MTTLTKDKSRAAKTRATIKVGMSEMKFSRSVSEVIETGPLGSCVGITFYDPVAKVGGVMACMLPDSTVDPENAQANPCLFVDTGVPAMLAAFCELGGRPDQIVAKVVGAGTPLGREQSFCLGPRNHSAALQALADNGLAIVDEDVGGPQVRILSLNLADGITGVVSDGQEVQL